jgi:hypothetical protein
MFYGLSVTRPLGFMGSYSSGTGFPRLSLSTSKGYHSLTSFNDFCNYLWHPAYSSSLPPNTSNLVKINRNSSKMKRSGTTRIDAGEEGRSTSRGHGQKTRLGSHSSKRHSRSFMETMRH